MARLLITDDDPAILGLIRAILEPEGFEIAEAHNGIEAVEAVEHSDFDLLILDIMMPEMDGLGTHAEGFASSRMCRSSSFRPKMKRQTR